jgi:predicted ATP-grasp superfamily ATP-dependent carboligase
MPALTMRGPILVSNGDTAIGLAMIRSLARHGVETHTSVSDPQGLGQYSRYTRSVLRLPRKIDEAVVKTIDDYCRLNHITHVLAVSEPSIIFLNKHRDWFEPRVRLLFPPQEIFNRALYKDQTFEIAKRCGIEVPKSFTPRTVEEAEAWTGLHYPVILKPRHRDSALGTKPVYLLKSERADTRTEMILKLRSYEASGELPMVQEFVAGTGLGVSAVMRNGNPVCLIQHRRLREYPPSGGVSVYCESMNESPDLVERSVALLRALDWEGVAMVEYRYDELSGHCWLMEVNGRFWGSLPLALHAGVEFPYLLYRSCFETVECQRATPGVRARALAGDTKWLIAVLRNGDISRGRAVWDYLRAFHPATKYFVWALDDPKPAIMNFLNRFKPSWIQSEANRD